MDDEESLREKIRELLEKFYTQKDMKDKFIPGEKLIRVGGTTIDHNEIIALVDSILDGWYGIGKTTRIFEIEFSKYIGIKDSAFVNSGSSANLLAVASLCSEQFPGKLNPGDEVITPAMTFPTTISPIMHYGLKPVFPDVNTETFIMDAQEIEKAISDKTKLIMFHHPLGNPYEMDAISDLANDHNLLVVEDTCDALGSTYDGKMLGTFGVFGTFSFYAAHHMSTGEGGMIVSNSHENLSIARSLRDWGRFSWCPSCQKPLDTTYDCPHRFDSFDNELPKDYDRRYTYMNIGYNFKPVEFQAAMGLEQLKKLPNFIKIRKRNFETLYKELSKWEKFFIFPQSLPKADTCWFSFPLTIRDNAPFKRSEIVQWLEKNKIETRPLFTGNILKQPAYRKIQCRIVNNLKNTDKIMHDSFFIGVYPSLTEEKINYVIQKFDEFLRKFG